MGLSPINLKKLEMFERPADLMYLGLLEIFREAEGQALELRYRNPTSKDRRQT